MARQQQIPLDLRSFIIPNVRRTGRQLGNGAFGSVEELEFDGLVCAGRKLRDTFLNFDDLDMFYRECRLVSVLRHPNVVQFLGLCFLPDIRSPVMVMEEMKISLHDLLKIVPDIDLTAKISILQDVARGLVYLHNHNPPIILRRLKARSISLNCGMVAKITGFCMSSRVISDPYITPNAGYLPPEFDVGMSWCNASADMFSFGHITLCVAIQELPNVLPPVYADPHSASQLIARSEVERRGKYLAKLEATLDGKHPLVLLTRRCLHNQPEKRPTALQALEMLKNMMAATQDPHGDIGRLLLQESLLGHKEKRSQENELQAALFAELKPFTRNVQSTGKLLGHGAYGSVVEVKMGEKLFAAKSFREVSLTNVKSFVHTFCARVMLLFQLSHPNILKYEGICYMSSQDKMPSLLMERMTCDLHSYLICHENRSRNLPIIDKASILRSIANGLRYLHGQTPAVIHRDLTATNVLLDSRLVAKIADFGNARIIDLNPLATPQTMTANPGTITYMPPEVWEESSENADKLDIFSFGHLSLFTIVQESMSLLAPTYMDEERICAHSEIERRGKYMKKAEQMLGDSHVLVVVIKRCLEVNVRRRPSAEQLFSVLQKFLDSLPQNQLDMGNLHEIISYLMELSKEQIYSLGLALGLTDYTLEESRDSSVRMYLSHMLKAWLRRQDGVEIMSGPPTWKSLVKALRDVTVRQNGIVSKIEEDKLQPND